MDQFGLTQIVKQDTWSRMVGTTLRSSLLDHVYTGDTDCIYKIECFTPCFGDHKLLSYKMLNGSSLHKSKGQKPIVV